MTTQRERNGRYTSPQAERRKAWANTLKTVHPAKQQITMFSMSPLEIGAALQRAVERTAK
jgi:hypothetical protein